MEWIGSNYKDVVKWGAFLDIVTIGPFALPIIVNLQLSNLKKIHDSLALGGEFPEFESLHVLFCVLMGVLLLVWSILRVIHPDPILGLFSGIAGAFFATFTYYFITFENISEVFYIFVLYETISAVINIGGYFTWWATAHPKRKIKTVTPRRKAQ